MASVNSAGIVLYRLVAPSDPSVESSTEILLVHPGGPFWGNKDQHGWSIPKGEFDPETEDGREAAWREFEEELGHPVPKPVKPDRVIPLPPFRAGRKTIHAWLVKGDLDPTTIVSSTVEIEWPPRSGRRQTVPEVDRAAWFGLSLARTKLHKGQTGLVDLVIDRLNGRS